MRPEITELRYAVNLVRILLEHGTVFTLTEETVIEDCAETLRRHLATWRARQAPER